MNERLIELKLKDSNQLFNSMDPAPFHEKDLDGDAEQFIISWAQEFPAKCPLKLRIHFEQPAATDTAGMIQKAVNNYFSYRKEMARRDFRHLMRQGRTTLLIGLAFLVSCLAMASVARNHFPSVWTDILGEGFTIAGWVAMWRPIQLYLYDWWPVQRDIRMFEKLSRMPVEVVSK